MKQRLKHLGKKVILVNGVPASGKSTIASMISNEFDLPVLTLDTIKEPFMLLHSQISRDFNRELGKAAYHAIWSTVKQAPANCVYVIDAWFGFQPKELLLQYLNDAEVSDVLEIWNQISGETAASRYISRSTQRPKGHPGNEYAPELTILANKAKPMSLGDVFTIKQDAHINYESVFARVQEFIEQRSLSNVINC